MIFTCLTQLSSKLSKLFFNLHLFFCCYSSLPFLVVVREISSFSAVHAPFDCLPPLHSHPLLSFFASLSDLIPFIETCVLCHQAMQLWWNHRSSASIRPSCSVHCCLAIWTRYTSCYCWWKDDGQNVWDVKASCQHKTAYHWYFWSGLIILECSHFPKDYQTSFYLSSFHIFVSYPVFHIYSKIKYAS